MYARFLPQPLELQARRDRVAHAIGEGAVALVAAAPAPRRSVRFRQTNEFYYLTAAAEPGAYVVIDGGTGRTTLYLAGRDAHRERSEGPSLAAEDVEPAKELTGTDEVKPVADLPAELARRLFRGRVAVHTPFAPGEGARQSRDALLNGSAARLADPLGSSVTRESALVEALAKAFPAVECCDLTPVLDELRLVKSESELAAMREAARLTCLATVEAMRSTEQDVHEYELSAVADFVFLQGGAAGAAYEPIIAGGSNAWHGHYVRKDSKLAAGDLVLFDCAPDFHYYTSDIGRMWPVTGRFEPWQLELYEFIVHYHRALLGRIRPGETVEAILDDTAAELTEVVETTSWSRPEFETAARGALAFRGHLSHPVGMAVHDVGNYSRRPLVEGLVFSVDPMLWVPEESLYVRCEDTVVVTADGIENLTAAAPLDPSAIEATMSEPGLLQAWRDR